MLDSFVLQKLGSVRAQYEELGAKLEQPDVQANVEELLKTTKERAKLEPTVLAHDSYIAAETAFADAKEMFASAATTPKCGRWLGRRCASRRRPWRRSTRE